MIPQPIDHHAALAELMPQQIAANVETIRQIEAALAARDNRVPLRGDHDFFERLNTIFAPVHQTQVQGNIPKKTDEALVNNARNRINLMRSMGNTEFTGLSYLDIGCGRGYCIEEARRQGASYCAGIDTIPLRRREWDERRGNTPDMEFILDDLHTHDFGGRRFDVISSINSFEHFDEPPVILRRCREVISDDGILFIFFNPIFRAPMGSHQYRRINIPYVQNLFDDEVTARFLCKDETANPYPGLNRKTVAEFEHLLLRAEEWQLLALSKTTDYRFAWMTRPFREELGAFDDEDLFISGIQAALTPSPS